MSTLYPFYVPQLLCSVLNNYNSITSITKESAFLGAFLPIVTEG